jgi:gamma-carbonic anhydrase
VGSGSIVAAGAVVAPFTEIPAGQLWAGNPAKFLRPLKPNEEKYLGDVSAAYTGLSQQHDSAIPKTLEAIAAADLAALKA